MNQKVTKDTYELAHLELKKSPFYSRIPANKIKYFIDNSISIGNAAAVQEKAKSKDIMELIKSKGITVNIQKEKTIGKDFSLRAEVEFKENHKSITVYEESIHSIWKMIENSLDEDVTLTQEDIVNIHLAHEYFHYLEFTSGEIVSSLLDKVTVLKLFGYEKNVEVLQTSEIAAHAFAMEYCNLHVFPNYYDYTYLIMKNN